MTAKFFLMLCVFFTLPVTAWSAPKPSTPIHRVPDTKVLPNQCSATDRGTNFEAVHYGLMMGRAYKCLGMQLSPFLNYGCYCGEGNTGVDTKPADAVDAQCRVHDLNLWAICENPKYNEPSGQSCNCYHHYVSLGCENGKIVVPKNLTACQLACVEDTIQIAEATRKVFDKYDSSHLHRWMGTTPERPLQKYCSETTSDLPFIRFAPESGIEVPDSGFWPIGIRAPKRLNAR